MKRSILKYTLVFVAIVAITVPAFSQYSRKRKKSGPSDFTERLWVGGFVGFPQFGNGIFIFGLTPMAGYEVIPNVSIGPLLRMEYRYQEFGSGQSEIRFSTFDVGPGAFLRFDFGGQFFAQAEYESAFLRVPSDPQMINNGKIETEGTQQNYFYLGAGFISGADVKFSTSIHYNVLDDTESVRFPWDIRFGVRWNLVPESERTVDDRKKSSSKKRKKRRRR